MSEIHCRRHFWYYMLCEEGVRCRSCRAQPVTWWRWVWMSPILSCPLWRLPDRPIGRTSAEFNSYCPIPTSGTSSSNWVLLYPFALSFKAAHHVRAMGLLTMLDVATRQTPQFGCTLWPPKLASKHDSWCVYSSLVLTHLWFVWRIYWHSIVVFEASCPPRHRAALLHQALVGRYSYHVPRDFVYFAISLRCLFKRM